MFYEIEDGHIVIFTLIQISHYSL